MGSDNQSTEITIQIPSFKKSATFAIEFSVLCLLLRHYRNSNDLDLPVKLLFTSSFTFSILKYLI